MYGKNHLFTYERLEEVWDELDEICLGNCDDYEKYEHSFSSFMVADDDAHNITGRLTDETIDFIKRQTGPFLAWVNYQDPHPAFACPKKYYEMFSTEKVKLPESYKNHDPGKEPRRDELWRLHSEMDLCSEEDMKKAIATYMGQVRYVDDMVGKLMATLKETGRDKDTIVLFFADHGELLGNHGMTHKLPAFYDCLTRIPVILHHPEGTGAGMIFRGLVEEVDLVPTLLDFMDVPIPHTMVGKSVASEIRAGADKGKETILCEAGIAAPLPKKPIEGMKLKAPFAPTSFGCGAMIRKGEYKLSIYSDDRCELYNREEDPEEIHNLYGRDEYKEIQQELTLELLKRVLSVKVRDIGRIDWDDEEYPIDVRANPLEA